MFAPYEDRGPRIVVGVDGSPSSGAALRWAIRQAEMTHGIVDAVIAWQFPAGYGGHSWAPPAAADTVDYPEIAAKALADAIGSAVDLDADVSVRQVVVGDNAAQALLDAAVDADLLVVGSRGHAGFAGALLGSVSQHCVQHAPCPVVVIRGRPAS
jgi:nucleotide-binding universal stress UspA family protein